MLSDGKEFLDLIDSLKTLRTGTTRKMLILLAAGERKGVWVKFEGASRNAVNQRIWALRKKGWKLLTTTSEDQGTWSGIKTGDLSKKRTALTSATKHRPPSRRNVYKLAPEYMGRFREFLAVYRKCGGVIVPRWMPKRVRNPFRAILRTLRLSAEHTR